MNVTQKDVDAVSPKNNIILWPVTVSENEESTKIVNSLLGSKFESKVISLSSLANVLLSYREKMNEEEKNIFEKICSFFVGSIQDSQWIKNDEGEASHLIFDLQTFSELIQKAWTVSENKESNHEAEQAVDFLKNKSSEFNKIILQLDWGR